jgi:type I restriction enzyme, R subunit
MMRSAFRLAFSQRSTGASPVVVRLAIRDFLWSDATGLPVDKYGEAEVHERAEEVYRHVHRVYPEIPSPFYATSGVA